MAKDEFPLPENLEEGLFMGASRKEVPGLVDGAERAPDGRDLIVERRILQRLDEVLAEPEPRDDRVIGSLPDNPGVSRPLESRRGEEPVLPGKGP